MLAGNCVVCVAVERWVEVDQVDAVRVHAAHDVEAVAHPHGLVCEVRTPSPGLQEVVDSGRALTGARYSAITIGGEADPPHRSLSSGLTPDEHRQLAE